MPAPNMDDVCSDIDATFDAIHKNLAEIDTALSRLPTKMDWTAMTLVAAAITGMLIVFGSAAATWLFSR